MLRDRCVSAQSTASIELAILDVPLRVSGEGRDLAYIHTFIDAYEEKSREAGGSAIEVAVGRAESVPANGSVGPPVWVHHSKHRYWNILGAGSVNDGVDWRLRPVWTRHSDNGAEVLVSVAADAATGGEAAWHVCRSLALYLRDPHDSKLLHASAVSLDGRCVLFIGSVCAGKTTLMSEAMLAHGAQPLANDRVLVKLSEPLEARSWPSYASFTEGTLLDYAPLRAAALAYDGRELARRYTKDAKRIYPMQWLSRACARPYVRAQALGAIVLSHLSPRIERASVARLDIDQSAGRNEVAALLRRECFDECEPSFCPWHGLPLPAGAASAERLVEELSRQDMPVYRLHAPAPGFQPALAELLNRLR